MFTPGDWIIVRMPMGEFYAQILEDTPKSSRYAYRLLIQGWKAENVWTVGELIYRKGNFTKIRDQTIIDKLENGIYYLLSDVS